MNIVLLGAPGSGKGTQAEALESDLGLAHISSGDLFRDHLNRKTALGLRAREYMNRGKLVPDQLTNAMLHQRLKRLDPSTGLVLDGFPRTLAQAEALDEMLANVGRRLDGVLYIEVPDEELVGRLAGRLICRECQASFHTTSNPFHACPLGKCHGESLYRREDDNPETVRARLATFHQQTAPLIEYYRRPGLLVTVPGSGSVDEVKRATLDAARRIQTKAVSPKP